MAEECIFCKIIRGEIPSDKIYENKHIFSLLDNNPIAPGHTLVIPKKHFKTILDIPEQELCELIKGVKKMTMAVVEATDAPGFNIIVNGKKAAGQLVDHIHFHIIPRFKHDNIRYECPAIKYKEGQKQEIMDRIKKVLK